MSDVLQAIERMSQLLQSSADATDLAQQLGAITQDSGNEIIVQPKDAVFNYMSIVTQPDSAEPAHIRFRLATPIELSTLSAEFGAPKQTPRTSKGRVKQIFNSAYPGESYNVTLIVEGGETAVDLVLRRDIRLD